MSAGQAWFQKKPKIAHDPESVANSSRMEGIWDKCDECGDIMLREELEKALNVCPSCGHHMQLPARQRLAALCDPDSFEEFDTALESTDPLSFSDSKKYKDRIKSTMKALGEKDAFISGDGTIASCATASGPCPSHSATYASQSQAATAKGNPSYAPAARRPATRQAGLRSTTTTSSTCSAPR